MNKIINRKITTIRPMTPNELSDEGWDAEQSETTVVVLDNGIRLYPSRDDEGNGPGVMFGLNPDGTAFRVG